MAAVTFNSPSKHDISSLGQMVQTLNPEQIEMIVAKMKEILENPMYQSQMQAVGGVKEKLTLELLQKLKIDSRTLLIKFDDFRNGKCTCKGGAHDLVVLEVDPDLNRNISKKEEITLTFAVRTNSGWDEDEYQFSVQQILSDKAQQQAFEKMVRSFTPKEISLIAKQMSKYLEPYLRGIYGVPNRGTKEDYVATVTIREANRWDKEIEKVATEDQVAGLKAFIERQAANVFFEENSMGSIAFTAKEEFVQRCVAEHYFTFYKQIQNIFQNAPLDFVKNGCTLGMNLPIKELESELSVFLKLNPKNSVFSLIILSTADKKEQEYDFTPNSVDRSLTFFAPFTSIKNRSLDAKIKV